MPLEELISGDSDLFRERIQSIAAGSIFGRGFAWLLPAFLDNALIEGRAAIQREMVPAERRPTCLLEPLGRPFEKVWVMKSPVAGPNPNL